MSEQLLSQAPLFVRADFSFYPTVMSDDGEWLISSGYAYKRIRQQNGSAASINGRDLYQRLHQGQTFPNRLPNFTSHNDLRDWLMDEALAMIADFQSGKTKAEFSYRFRNCVYDNMGLFVESKQGSAYVPSYRESQDNLSTDMWERGCCNTKAQADNFEQSAQRQQARQQQRPADAPTCQPTSRQTHEEDAGAFLSDRPAGTY